MGIPVIGLLSGLVSLGLHHVQKYRQFWWWDNVAHFHAGVFIGAASRQLPRPRSPRDAAIIAVLISILWEASEYVHGAWPYKQEDVGDDQRAEDTILDTILVALGAAFAAWLDQDS